MSAADVSGVVLFLGDATVVDPQVHALVNERMAASSQALDFEVFRFAERPVGDIETALRQVGMFSPKRCIWLRGFVESRRKAAAGGGDDDQAPDDQAHQEQAHREQAHEEQDGGGTAELLALLEGGIPDGTLLVVSAAALDARSRLFKWFAKHAEVHDRRVGVEHTGQRRGKLSEEGLRRAIDERLRELGVRTIGSGAIDEIIKRSGNVVGETLQEVDRLVLAQADPARLGPGDVRSGMRDLALGWVFDFTAALEKRDLATAETLIARLLADGEPALRLSAVLASHFAKLAAARGITDSLPHGWLAMRGSDFLRGPGASLPEAFRGWPGYFRLRAAAAFTPEELRRLHGEVRRLDAALKSSAVSPLLLFSRLLQKACIHGAAA